MSEQHSNEWWAGYAQGMATGIEQGQRDERATIEGVLADAFRRHPESSQKAWQDALTSVSKREYLRGVAEGKADD